MKGPFIDDPSRENFLQDGDGQACGGKAMSTVVAVHGVRFAYNARSVIEDLSLEVNAGDFFIVIGPNGSGKTTLLRLVLGSLKPAGGTVDIFDRPAARIGRRDLARRVALVPQAAAVAFPFSVRQIVAMGRAPHLGLLGFEGSTDREAVDRALATVRLEALSDRMLDQLSGGERQRVWIARALCQEPDLLLLDEPTAALDMGHQLQIMRLLARLRREQGLTVMMVSHDLNLAAMFATRMLLLRKGRVVCLGAPEAVLRAEHIRTAYGCEVLVDRHPQGGFPRLTLPA